MERDIERRDGGQRDIDALVRAAGERRSGGSAQLFALLYDELHRLAERQLRRGGPGAPLSATTLLHEAYLGLAGREGVRFPDRARFLAYAARAMRGVLIDHARRAAARKRGGGQRQVTLSGIDGATAANMDVAALERLSDALDELGALEPALAELVDMHFFCGYGLAEIAALRGVSERTVHRDWRKARLLLQRAVGS